MTGGLPGYLRVTVVTDRMVGWGEREAELVDPAGTVSRRWQLPDLTVAVQDRPALGRPRVYSCSTSTGPSRAWNDER